MCNKGTLYVAISRGRRERIIINAYVIFVPDCLNKSICYGYSCEIASTCRGNSNEYPQHMLLY